MLIRSCWLIVLSSSISLLIFCLVVLSVVERQGLTSPAVILNLHISPFSYISFQFTYFAAFRVYLMVTDSLTFPSSENSLSSPSVLEGISTGLSILGWQSFSFNMWKMSCFFSLHDF